MPVALTPARLLAAVVAIALSTAVAGCGSGSSVSTAAAVTVKASDTTCEVTPTTLPVGPVRFEVTNAGSGVTEFYFQTASDNKTVAEAENIGPGTSRDTTATVTAGSYVGLCKPEGGDPIQVELTAK